MESVMERPATDNATNGDGAQKEGKGRKAKPKPVITPEAKQFAKRLEEQHKLGEAIQRRDADRAKQETKCATIKAELDDERETLHGIEKEVEEMKDDLIKLAVGGFVDRLPFGDKPVDGAPSNGQASPAPAPVAPDAWRAVPLADVWKEVGAPVALLTALIDGKVKAGPQKGQPADIRTLGQLADFAARPHAKLTDIGGIGPEKANTIEDAMLKYWAKHPQPAAAPAPAASGLDWKAMSDTQHFADTRSGIKVGEGKSTPQFVVSKDGDKWDVGQSSGPLMPAENPGAFETIEAEKAWCEKREAELCAKAEYVPLEWEKHEAGGWFAANTAGIETEADLLAEFYVRPDEHGLSIDMTEDTLLPGQFPLNFPDLASAQAYCEARNRELCLKAREQMPELYDDKPAKKAKPKAKKTPKRKTVVKK